MNIVIFVQRGLGKLLKRYQPMEIIPSFGERKSKRFYETMYIKIIEFQNSCQSLVLQLHVYHCIPILFIIY